MVQKEPKIGRPSAVDSASELVRTFSEAAWLAVFWRPLVDKVPKGNGAPVMILPGFGGGDTSTFPLRNFLKAIGYRAYAWRNGTNTGLNEKTAKHIKERLQKIYVDNGGQKVKLIGHSLGGVFARELAREFPHLVDSVITLGSPFGAAGHPDSTIKGVRAIYDLLNPGEQAIDFDSEEMHQRSLTPPDVPTTSLYTRYDGIVHWKTCINPESDKAENIEILASHCGLVVNAMSYFVIADRLAQNADDWKPFDRSKCAFFSLREEKHEKFTPDMPNHDNDNGPSIF